MKNLFYSLLFISNFTFCQKKCDYKILNQIKIDLFNLNKKDTIRLKNEILSFKNQEEIFDKTFFNNFRYPTIGVDSLKIAELYETLDFDFLKQNKRKRAKNWIIDKFKDSKIIEYTEKTKPIDFIKYQRVYSISLPVFSKDRKYLFIYYEYFCGSECGSSGIKIYKKVQDKWEYFNQLPLTIS